MRSAVVSYDENIVVVQYIETGARLTCRSVEWARRSLSIEGYVHEHSSEEDRSFVELWVKPGPGSSPKVQA